MKALSIRQPWAWLILFSGKDIENRVWRTNYRGTIAVHAAKGMTENEYDDVVFDLGMRYLADADKKRIELPAYRDLARGGIVGTVDIIDCVSASTSSWFCGPRGFVLANPRPLPFHPCRGSLGLFDVPDFDPGQ